MAKRAQAPARYDEFLFWVRRPSATYSFGLQHERGLDDPYREHQSLTFIAECIYPDRFKERTSEAQFFARDELGAGSEHRSKRPENPPKAVGSILTGKARFDVGGFLPTELCWRLGEAMASGVITSMAANAKWIKPSHAYITSISFRGPEFDPIAYIG